MAEQASTSRTPLPPASEERNCIACGASGPFPALYERGGYTMVRCPQCGLVFQHPPPDDEVLEGAYYHDDDFARALFEELRPVTLASARRKLELLGGSLPEDARVLDVGASSGAWLEVAAGAGASAVGVEIGETTASAARERGLDVRTGTLALVAPDLGAERFDLITFWDVLEHLRDPRRELELAASLLAPGGRIAATFPNVEGLYPRLTYRLFAPRTGVWEYPELPVHLYDFSPRTAARVFAQAGLDLERVDTFATPYDFYRSTSLSADRLGTSPKARLLRAAFGALRLVVYPIAALADRGNSMFVVGVGSPH